MTVPGTDLGGGRSGVELASFQILGSWTLGPSNKHTLSSNYFFVLYT